MEHAALFILLALLQYLWFTMRVGTTRGKYNVDAPACDGNETWLRLYRVHQNTLEQLVVMIPGVALFSYYVSDMWVAVPGAAFIIGRFLYSAQYLKDPKTRAPGMIITIASNATLVVGALVGLLLHIF